MDKIMQREVKIFRLGQLIQEHPTYSYTRLNKALIKEFGSGLRKQYTLGLIRGIRPVRIAPVKAPEDTYNGRYHILKQKGFYASEAKELARMKDIKPKNRMETFKSGTWTAAINAHKEYTANLVKVRAKIISKQARARGIALTPQRILIRAKYEVERMLKQAMASGEYSPYDWLKVEYKPKKVATGYIREARALAIDRINRVIDKAKHRQAVKFWD